MILYFSATGNTKATADKLSSLLEDESLNLLDRIRKHDISEIYSDKPFVICAPVYVCEMPRFMAAFLKEVPLTGSRDVYFVFTSGGYTGIGGKLAGSLMRKKGMNFKGYTQLKMPRNYIANDHYPELSEEEIRRRIEDCSKMIPLIAQAILKGEKLTDRHVWLFETVITLPFNPVWCRVTQKVKPFYVNDKCISCGRCEKICPLNIISMKDGNPVWEGKSCSHCMSCIQNCPVEAIEYGNITQSKKRYLYKKYCNR